MKTLTWRSGSGGQDQLFDGRQAGVLRRNFPTDAFEARRVTEDARRFCGGAAKAGAEGWRHAAAA